MSRTTLSTRQEKLKFNPPFIVTIINSTSNIDINSNLSTNLTISKSDPVLIIKGTSENQKSIIYLGTPFGDTGVLKTAIIADGGIASAVGTVGFSRSKLYFCLNNVADNVNSVSIADARMTIIPSGNVGIGHTNPAYKLHITAGKTAFSTAFAMKVSGGVYTDSGNHGTLIGLGSEDGSFTKCAIGHVRNDTNDRGDIVFLANNTNDSSTSCSMSDEKMRISKFGNVGIGNTNPLSLLSLNIAPISADAFSWNNCPMTITHPTITGQTILNDPKPVLHLCRDGTVGINYGERATFNICRYEHSGSSSRTRLDIGLTNGNFNDEICVMSLRSDGNVGIGKNDPQTLLHIKGTNPALTVMGQGGTGATVSINLNTFDNLTNPGSCSLIATDTGSYGNTFKINLKTAGGALSSSQFTAFYIDNTGKVNIGSQAPTNILQVGDGARLRISNGPTDYTLIGTKDVDDTTNTRIVISGNNRGSSLSGCIEYLASTDIGDHIFKTSGQNEKMRIAKDGLVTTAGNISCGGGISLIGANAFYNTTSVTPANITNTFLSFRGSGLGNDWAYLRNIGGDETIKLALDFHDDAVDARFCIRSINSAGSEPDNIVEVFTVDNGNVTVTGQLSITTSTYNPLFITTATTNNVVSIELKNNSTYSAFLGIGCTAYDGYYKNNLYIQSPQSLIFNTNANGSSTTPSLIINTSGNVGIGITNPGYKLEVNGTTYIKGSTSGFSAPLVKIEQTAAWDGNYCLQTVGYSDLGGIRINGADIGNSIYKTDATGDMGLTVNNGNMIFNVNAAERMRINNSGNIGIGTNNPLTRLHIEHASQSSNTNNGGLYVYNPNNTANNCSVIGIRIGGSNANKALLSFDSVKDYGWSIYITGNDSLKSLKFNNSSNGSGIDRFTISDAGVVSAPAGFSGPLTGNVNGNCSGTAGSLTNGDKTITGNLTTSGTLSFGTRTPDYLIYLYGTDYGFGINSGVLRYNSGGSHKFYSGATNTATINNTGDITATTFSGSLNGNCSGSSTSLTAGNKTITGTLTVGSVDANYPNGDTWFPNIMLNCSDNAEIAVHDGGTRLASLIFFEGGATNRIHIGKNKGWDGDTNVNITNHLAVGGSINMNGSLLISGSYYAQVPTNSRLSWNGSYVTVDSPGYQNISVKATYNIWTAGYFLYSSDIRIKKNINDINDDFALQKIMQIQPKTYNYIDTLNKSNDIVYGFIAQQIKEVIPEAVHLTSETIPNIYTICECANNIVILDNNFISSNNIKINDNIDIIDINNVKKEYTIIDILDNKIKINENLISSNCFVYGTKVNDFNTIDKSYIFTLNVCATQELYKQNQEQKEKIILLEQQNTKIENRIKILESKL